MENKQLSSTSEGFAELCVDILTGGRSVRFTAHGSSMQHLVRDGDVLLVEPAQSNSLRLGMIVLCTVSPGRVVAHRVIGRKTIDGELKCLIQGDHVEKPDGWFNAKDIVGKIISIERDGTVIDLRTPQARVLAVLAAVKVRGPLSRRNRLLSCLYSRIRRLPIFKVFFS